MSCSHYSLTYLGRMILMLLRNVIGRRSRWLFSQAECEFQGKMPTRKRPDKSTFQVF